MAEPQPVSAHEIRLLLTISEAAAVCGMSYEMAANLARSEWPVVTLGERTVLVPVAGLEDWIRHRMGPRLPVAAMPTAITRPTRRKA